MNYITVYIRELGSEKHFFNVKGRGINCISIPEFKSKQTAKFDDAPIMEEPAY